MPGIWDLRQTRATVIVRKRGLQKTFGLRHATTLGSRTADPTCSTSEAEHTEHAFPALGGHTAEHGPNISTMPRRFPCSQTWWRPAFIKRPLCVRSSSQSGAL